MAKHLISFPSAAMVVPDGEWEAGGRDAHAVIDEAKAAGVYVFGGGIDEDVPPVLVSADGTVAGRLSLGAHARWRLHRVGTAFARRGHRVGGAYRQGLSVRPRTARLRVRPTVLRATLKWRGKCGLTTGSSRRKCLTAFTQRLNLGVII